MPGDSEPWALALEEVESYSGSGPGLERAFSLTIHRWQAAPCDNSQDNRTVILYPAASS